MWVKSGNVFRFQAWAHLDGFGRVDFEVLSSKRCYLTSSWWLGGWIFKFCHPKRCNLTSFWWPWKAGFSKKQNLIDSLPILSAGSPPGFPHHDGFWKSRFWGFVIQKVLFDLILMTGRVDFQVLSSKRCNLTSFWWLWKAGFSKKWNPHRFSPHRKPPGPPGVSSSWWLLEE